ncbi:hypothetical protein DNTS_026665 [Danionella cerebrum]|uniref:Mut7-C RNAse domain-containing protein n=1 Tax=Danionella cerebrum TaxID=2873325 RepID=A0A553P8V4_9TELE|nr:hypothetical protein DNTS_026665 [Danionella translucida]
MHLLHSTVSKREDFEELDDIQVDYNSWRDTDAPNFRPNCRWAPDTALDVKTLCFPSGAQIQVEIVPPGLLARIPLYFICTGCGKVFWEGTHFDRVRSQFLEVLKDANAALLAIAGEKGVGANLKLYLAPFSLLFDSSSFCAGKKSSPLSHAPRARGSELNGALRALPLLGCPAQGPLAVCLGWTNTQEILLLYREERA